MTQINLFMKHKQTHKYRKENYGSQREKRGRDKLGVWDWQIQITIYKIDKEQGPNA